MRRRERLGSALCVVAAVVLAAAPAGAQPTPATPAAGQAMGDAGTGLAVVRVTPATGPAAVLMPGYAGPLRQGALELGIGLSSAQVDSESQVAWEHSIAIASPVGVAVQGTSPQTPGSVTQVAPADNPDPTSLDMAPPPTPLDALMRLGTLRGSAHARWDDPLGPCVEPISRASTELASLSALTAIPALPGISQLSGQLSRSTLDAEELAELTESIGVLSGPLSELGGLLTGPGGPRPGTGPLVEVAGAVSTRSTVRLVDLPGSANKAVESTSTFQMAGLNLLPGTPFAMTAAVVGQPELRAVATGDAATSTIDYTAPIVEVRRGDRVLYRLDAAHPTVDIPIGIAPPGLRDQLPAEWRTVPLIGDLAGALPADSPLMPVAGELNARRQDIAVLRLTIAGMRREDRPMTAPFAGQQIGAAAHTLDVAVLPTDALGIPGLPGTLAAASFGEQVVRAAAPTGGVSCAATGRGAPVSRQGGAYQTLAYSNAYQAVPLLCTGAALLAAGVLITIIATVAGRRPRRNASSGPSQDRGR